MWPIKSNVKCYQSIPKYFLIIFLPFPNQNLQGILILHVIVQHFNFIIQELNVLLMVMICLVFQIILIHFKASIFYIYQSTYVNHY